MSDELTKVLLLEGIASEDSIANALFASVTGGVPLVQALTRSGAVGAEVLARYLARTEAPYLRHVAPVLELAERLPRGLCARLFALPVRQDAITGTVDVAVADAADPHPAQEIAFHLRAPVRLVRAPVAAIDEALRRLEARSIPPPSARSAERHPRRPTAPTWAEPTEDRRIDESRGWSEEQLRERTLPPAEAALRGGPPRATQDASSRDTIQPKPLPGLEPQKLVVPGLPRWQRRSSVTPPWGTQVHSGPPSSRNPESSGTPRPSLGSEIPIPLTRRTFTAVSGGTQRPPPLVDPTDSMGEGYAVDAGHFRQIVEVNEHAAAAFEPETASPQERPPPIPSFIPGPPTQPGIGALGAYASQFTDLGAVLDGLRAAVSRDQVLELILLGASMVAAKAALFVVKRGGYRGWTCSPDFGELASVQSILVPLERPSVFNEAVRDGLYFGAMPHDQTHAAIHRVMRGATSDVAAVAVRVGGRTAVVLLADELDDTMLSTRSLQAVANAAGDAFEHIVRMRR